MKTPEEKVQDLMLKIRKGATASIDANAHSPSTSCRHLAWISNTRSSARSVAPITATIYQAKFQTKEPNVRSYYDLFPWLKAETDFMERVLCYLGMEEQAEELVKFFTAKVNDWKLQPLPGEKK